MNKGLLVLGAAGSGKTTFLEKLYKEYNEFEFIKWINPDFYVEDKDHKFYKDPLGASRYIKKEIFPEILSEKRDFIFDTTGANIKTIKKIIDDNPTYEFKILMIFCQPVISFKRNLLRERKLPKQVVLQNWLSVYSQISEYKKLIGDGNMYIYETEYSYEERKILYSDYFGIKLNILELLENNDATSSFKKESTKYTEKELKEKEQKFNNILTEVSERFEGIQLQQIGLDLLRQEVYDNLLEWISENK